MPSSFSVSLRFEMQFTGENVNTWGEHLNAVIKKIDFAIAGLLTLPVAGNVVLSTSNLLDDQARVAMIKLTGAGGYSITIPSVSKKYLVNNAAGIACILTTGLGTSITIDPGDIIEIHCDGVDVRELGYAGLGLKAYIASVAFAASGSLPALAGNAGKFTFTDGSLAYWKSIQLADVADYAADRANILDEATALAVAL